MPVHPFASEPMEIPSFDRSRKFRFLGSLYAFHHTRRFEWLKKKIAALRRRDLAILEIGCNDARSLDYIPVPVRRYVGLDAGWRSGWKAGRAYGLDAAEKRFQNQPGYEFHRSQRHEDLERVRGTFDVAILLETFEYLEPTELESYVAAISGKLNQDGCVLSTMPNEKGLPLLAKAVGSRLSGVRRSEYTATQFWNAFIGKMDKVPRAVRGRRGFDYSAIANLVRQYFPKLQLEAVEPENLPLWLSLNIGMVASKAHCVSS
jgi:hypothetical protein